MTSLTALQRSKISRHNFKGIKMSFKCWHQIFEVFDLIQIKFKSFLCMVLCQLIQSLYLLMFKSNQFGHVESKVLPDQY